MLFYLLRKLFIDLTIAEAAVVTDAKAEILGNNGKNPPRLEMGSCLDVEVINEDFAFIFLERFDFLIVFIPIPSCFFSFMAPATARAEAFSPNEASLAFKCLRGCLYKTRSASGQFWVLPEYDMSCYLHAEIYVLITST